MKGKKKEAEKFDIDLGDDFNEALRRLLNVPVPCKKRSGGKKNYGK